MKLINLIKGLALGRFNIRIPLRVTQEVTSRCNLRCKYCEVEGTGNELDTPTIKAMMREFKSSGTISWGFTGGEPLLLEDIGELVSYAKKLGFITSLITNGLLL